MHSSQYKELIEKCRNVISQISGLYGYLGDCSSEISSCKKLMDETTIDGESIDKGKLDNLSSVLNQLKSAFNTVVAECKLKISQYEILYIAALEAERRALQEKENASDNSNV